jgi:hypothetical protein
MQNEIMLSKWWSTPSAKQALIRAEQAKKEKLAKLRESVAAKKAQQQKELEEWEIK